MPLPCSLSAYLPASLYLSTLAPSARNLDGSVCAVYLNRALSYRRTYGSFVLRGGSNGLRAHAPARAVCRCSAWVYRSSAPLSLKPASFWMRMNRCIVDIYLRLDCAYWFAFRAPPRLFHAVRYFAGLRVALLYASMPNTLRSTLQPRHRNRSVWAAAFAIAQRHNWRHRGSPRALKHISTVGSQNAVRHSSPTANISDLSAVLAPLCAT